MKGIGASDGIAVGRAKRLNAEETVPAYTVEDTAAEVKRAMAALETAQQAITALLNGGTVQAETTPILEAHREILADPELWEQVKQEIESTSQNAERAFFDVLSMYEQMFAAMEDEYLRERAADMRDIRRRILRVLQRGGAGIADAVEESGVVLVAEDIGPSELAAYDATQIAGLITGVGGTSSHSAIIARSLGIPAVVGVGAALAKIADGALIGLNSTTGEIIVNPTAQQQADLEEERRAFAARQQQMAQFKSRPAVTREGDTVRVAANIAGTKDAAKAVDVGVDGVGLFRTEFLYMDGSNFPSEDEQFAAYREVLQAMQGKPVVIRTFDIGGDKPLSYLPIEESNPFLGYRAIRICMDRPDIFKTQLRALYRASEYGMLEIMFPMIATVEELWQALAMAEEARQEVGAERVPLGIMIETPAAVWMSDVLAPLVDFFSIVSNDLVQYTMACDRTNERVSYLNHYFQPAVLRSVQHVIAAAHRFGKHVAMCGEMAGDKALIPVLYAMGLDEFSMSAARVLAAKEVFSQLTRAEAQALCEKVLAAETGDEVKQILGVH
ncbi:phosphoenolpyruvate--protein phosphotransferase [Alicyclobacillus shizuokensis]|uniref:phosphoenolpyruvate--protein phosphotransferase n=1 Tax=Alicyclobacillus shizuokensis TaxID=392014 RepID=UPI001470419B|nr:phosphoenolpyruvate--protein phosphotransferase [Alicyclobacillus shizuokensis]